MSEYVESKAFMDLWNKYNDLQGKMGAVEKKAYAEGYKEGQIAMKDKAESYFRLEHANFWANIIKNLPIEEARDEK